MLQDLHPLEEFPAQLAAGPGRQRDLTYIHFEHPLLLPLSYVFFYARGYYGQVIRLQGPTAAVRPFLSFLLMSCDGY